MKEDSLRQSLILQLPEEDFAQRITQSKTMSEFVYSLGYQSISGKIFGLVKQRASELGVSL